MKIGIDARFYNESGVGRYIRNLITNLAKIDKKNEYVVFLLSDEYKGLQLPQRFTKRLADIRWHSLGEQLFFPSIIEREKLDLMHFPYFSVPVRYKGPFVITIHDLILHHFPTGKASTKSPLIYYSKWLAYRRIMRSAAKKARHIMTVSNATKDDIVKTLRIAPEKITVAYEGVDQTLKRTSAKPLVSGNYFLHVGNVYPHKNIERLVEAFSLLLAEESSDVQFVFVGKPDYFFDRLQLQIKQLGITEHVQLLGSVSDADLANLYEHAQATVIPSLIEGFGLPALEAMAHGCLVIASDIPVMHEICEAAAVYVDPYHAGSIKDGMLSVLSAGKQFSEQKKKGISRVKDFSWEEMAKTCLSVYERSTRL